MSLNYEFADFAEQSSKHKVLPVIETIDLGEETPLTVFEKLASGKPGSFLLESAEHGVWSRYSFIGVHTRGSLVKYQDGTAKWVSELGYDAFPSKHHAPLATLALDALEQLTKAWSTPAIAGLPPLTSGLVGLLSWDLIREIEHLPNRPEIDFAAPLLSMSMVSDLVVVDHQLGKILLVANVFASDNFDANAEYQGALGRIAALKAGLSKPSIVHNNNFDLSGSIEPKFRTDKADFIESLIRAKHFVTIGDVFQVVISQRFELELKASALDVYRVLREINASPYMYLLNFADEAGDFAVVGSSPEALVTVENSHATMHPIAGSRPRGKDAAHDAELAEGLLVDAKEKAEHLMLVDLARNDLLKVCEPSSVQVTEFMKIHKFSHIMHLVSTVEGDIRDDQSSVDAFRATFPAGTMSGAPKPRALEIIDELEPANRGVYSGVVGYFDFAGNADLAIAIRTAFLRDGKAYIQAGAGIVLDSVNESEFQETISKGSAPMRAVLAANRLHD